MEVAESHWQPIKTLMDKSLPLTKTKSIFFKAIL